MCAAFLIVYICTFLFWSWAVGWCLGLWLLILATGTCAREKLFQFRNLNLIAGVRLKFVGTVIVIEQSGIVIVKIVRNTGVICNLLYTVHTIYC